VKILHFHNGTGGGVLSVIRNLLKYRLDSEMENHVIYTINKKEIYDYKLPRLAEANSEQIFYFSSHWNFYYTCKQLAKCIPDEQTIIIAHDWLELGMVSHLGLNNPVVLVVHGDYKYYYDLAVKHADSIDIFICIAGDIANKLKDLLPNRIENIYYQRFPVMNPSLKIVFTGIRKLLFIGRCENAKGYSVLPLIEKHLRQFNRKVEWTIVGDGSDIERVKWPSGSCVQLLREIPNEKVLQLLPEHDLLLLPSLAEGMPVSVIEAMKAGLIPLVNDIPGGIQELVQNNITGYKIKNNDPLEYALTINMLCNDSGLVQQLSKNCIHLGRVLFNPIQNVKAFEAFYLQASRQNKKKKSEKIYGSRLDQPWIPNLLVTEIRKRSKNR
jgi:glycosyltransferase involved in cell wall biosynthesis